MPACIRLETVKYKRLEKNPFSSLNDKYILNFLLKFLVTSPVMFHGVICRHSCPKILPNCSVAY